MSLSFLFVAVVVLLCHKGMAQLQMNHCAPESNRAKVDCEILLIPPGLCTACRIGEFYMDGELSGNYKSCTKTYDMTANQCLDKLTAYVENNPCDTERAAGLAEYNQDDDLELKEHGRITLDYLLYALCENACDCFPRQTAQYDTPAIDVNRANCPAHATLDICRGPFQHAKVIRKLGETHNDDLATLPKVCEALEEWYESDLGQNPLDNPYTPLETHVKTFLEGYMEALELHESTALYNSCLDFEIAQRRVVDPNASPTESPTEQSDDSWWTAIVNFVKWILSFIGLA